MKSPASLGKGFEDSQDWEVNSRALWLEPELRGRPDCAGPSEAQTGASRFQAILHRHCTRYIQRQFDGDREAVTNPTRELANPMANRPLVFGKPLVPPRLSYEVVVHVVAQPFKTFPSLD